MESRFGRNESIEPMNPVHLYLGGVVQLQDKTNIAKKIADEDVIRKMTLDACQLIQDPAYFVHPDTTQDMKDAQLNRGPRNKVTREMLGMALHLAHNCPNHFSRISNQLVLKKYTP